MKIITKEELEKLRKTYPAGQMVELVKMDDPQAPPVGARGKVTNVDDAGTIHAAWENGHGSLGVAYGEDKCIPLSK